MSDEDNINIKDLIATMTRYAKGARLTADEFDEIIESLADAIGNILEGHNHNGINSRGVVGFIPSYRINTLLHAMGLPTISVGASIIEEIPVSDEISLAAFALPTVSVSTLLFEVFGTVTLTITNPGVVNYAAHGLAEDTRVKFTTIGALPTGLTANTIIYYVLDPLADSFNVALTAGGTSIQFSGSQSGVHTLLVEVV